MNETPSNYRWWNKPVSDIIGEKYLKLTGDQYFQPMQVGVKNRVTKLTLANEYRKRAAYDRLLDRLEAPTSISNFFADHWLRFSLFGIVDRFVTVRQTSLFANNAAVLRGSDNAAAGFNAMRKQGALSQYRGTLLGLLQLFAVPFEAYSLSEGDSSQFLAYLLALETALYPLDTLRTRYQADLSVKTRNVVGSLGKVAPGTLYAGLPFKLAFSSVFAYYLSRSGTGSLAEELKNLPFLLAAYPLLTLKSICQVTLNSPNPVSNVAGSFGVAEKFLKPEGLRVLYRGFVPFAALSLALPLSMPRLWSAERLEEVKARLDPEHGRNTDRGFLGLHL